MLYSEIKSKCKDQFVLLANPEYGDGFYPEKAELVFHHSNRDKVYDKAKEMNNTFKHITILYTGEIPEELDDNFAFIL